MAYVLDVEGPGVPTERYELSGDHYVGRSASSATIAIAADMVSRRHARFRETDGELTIEDLGSSNGTFVNRRVDVRDFDLCFAPTLPALDVAAVFALRKPIVALESGLRDRWKVHEAGDDRAVPACGAWGVELTLASRPTGPALEPANERIRPHELCASDRGNRVRLVLPRVG